MEEKFLRMIVYLYINSNTEIKLSLNNNKEVLKIILKLTKERKIKLIEKKGNSIVIKPSFFSYLKYI